MNMFNYFFARLRVKLEHLVHSITGARKRRRSEAMDAFEKVVQDLRPGSLAIDLGANVGDFTIKIASTGAKVLAFEPDPVAFQVLRERTKHLANVHLYQAAASTSSGYMVLHRHKEFQSDPVSRTIASSLLADHRRVSMDGACKVEAIDFVHFLLNLETDVALLKIDIEGAEVSLMEAVLASPAVNRLDHVFVETHMRMLPDLASRTRALVEMTKSMRRPIINWDWH